MANVVTINRPDVVALIEEAANKLTGGNKTEAVALGVRRPAGGGQPRRLVVWRAPWVGPGWRRRRSHATGSRYRACADRLVVPGPALLATHLLP